MLREGDNGGFYKLYQGKRSLVKNEGPKARPNIMLSNRFKELRKEKMAQAENTAFW